MKFLQLCYRPCKDADLQTSSGVNFNTKTVQQDTDDMVSYGQVAPIGVNM